MRSENLTEPNGRPAVLDRGLPQKRAGLLRWLAGVVALALVYFVTARLSLLIAIPPGYATAVWPASGVALAALLLYGQRLWPGILIGSCLANLLTALNGGGGIPVMGAVLVSASIATGASLQALLAARLVAPIFRRDPGLLHTTAIAAVLGLAGPLSCLVSATWGTTTLLLAGITDAERFLVNWGTWWTGDVIGILLVLPLAYIGLGRPRLLWRRRFASVALPLSLTLIAVTSGFFASGLDERRELRLEFERDAVQVGDSLARRLAVYLETIYSIQSFFNASKAVTREEFKQFVDRTLERVPGIHALSWNPRIRHIQRAGVEAVARRDGLHEFSITELQDETIVPADERPEYVFVNYIEPAKGNESALGFDVYSNPDRHAALNKARDTGAAVATGAVTLVQETGSQAGVLVFVPVYDGGGIPGSVEQKRSALLGYAVGVLRVGDVLRSTLAGLHVRNLDVRLFDEEPLRSGGLLAAYRIDENGATVPLDEAADERAGASMTWSSTYPMAGRAWRLRVTPAPGYFAAFQNWQAWVLLAGGLCLTGLLGVFLLSLSGRRILDRAWADQLAGANIRLRGEIEQREQTEQALQAEKDRAEVTLHSIGDAVITTDNEGRVEYLNPVAETLTEWSLSEAKGRPVASIFRVIVEETREAAEDPVKLCLQRGRVVNFMNQTVLISRSGREYAIQDSAAPIRDREGRVLGVVLVFNDVTESRRMVREVAHQASHDPLTGLYNRREFDKRLNKALASSKTYGSQHALCYLDLDQFKIVNDTAGHRAGDELLRKLSRVLYQQVRERDMVARLGGDEFGVLLENCPIERAIEIAEKLASSVRSLDFKWQDRIYEIGVSVGVVPISGDVESGEDLLSQADVACYTAKDLGRNRVHLYEPDADGADPRHRELLRAADIQRSVDEDRFTLHCQSIFDLFGGDSKQPWRHELLVRMLDVEGQIMQPSEFVPAAERFGLMQLIDRWVIATAFRDFAKLFPGEPATRISINLSGNSINDPGFLAFLRSQFEIHETPTDRVCFEITETAAIRNLHAARELMKQIRDLGGEFALDDFGSGLSSLSYLKSLPVNYLKIDGSFVRDIEHDLIDRAMVEAIHSVAQTLNLRTVAEYVESDECVKVLKEIGIDYAQGFALERPRPLSIESGPVARGLNRARRG